MQLSLADFELLRRVGDGSYSHVVLARHRASGKEYALKVIDKQYIMRWVLGCLLGAGQMRPGGLLGSAAGWVLHSWFRAAVTPHSSPLCPLARTHAGTRWWTTSGGSARSWTAWAPARAWRTCTLLSRTRSRSTWASTTAQTVSLRSAAQAAPPGVPALRWLAAGCGGGSFITAGGAEPGGNGTRPLVLTRPSAPVAPALCRRAVRPDSAAGAAGRRRRARLRSRGRPAAGGAARAWRGAPVRWAAVGQQGRGRRVGLRLTGGWGLGREAVLRCATAKLTQMHHTHARTHTHFAET